MIDKIVGQSKLLEKAISASSLRNQVISQNIANVDTPGYKRKTVAFEEFLSDAVQQNSFKGQRTDPRHIPIGENDIDNVDLRVRQDNQSMSVRLDGNNVDIESEMAAMAKNTIKYNALIQMLNSGYQRIKSVISEGRR